MVVFKGTISMCVGGKELLVDYKAKDANSSDPCFYCGGKAHNFRIAFTVVAIREGNVAVDLESHLGTSAIEKFQAGTLGERTVCGAPACTSKINLDQKALLQAE